MTNLLNTYFFKTLELQYLNNYFSDSIRYEYGEKEQSDEFCGFYFHGRDTPFTLEEHDIPIRSFRHFSEYSYPLYLFYNEASGGEIDELLRRYDNITVVPIDSMRSINDYDDFVINKMFNYTNINKTLTIHSDGYLINPGWEKFVLEHDFDYIGAPWCNHAGKDGVIFQEGCEQFYNIERLTAVGNGGFCFRKRDKCLQVVETVDQKHLNWKYVEGHLPDDVFFSYFGFGLGIFQEYDIQLAYKWALEPIMNWDTFGFHRTQRLIDRKLMTFRETAGQEFL